MATIARAWREKPDAHRGDEAEWRLREDGTIEWFNPARPELGWRPSFASVYDLENDPGIEEISPEWSHP